MHNAYLSAYARAIRPEPLLTVSEWADRYRLLDQSASSEAGQWRTSRTPYLREIMDCLSVSDTVTQQVVVMKGAQVGATEAGNNWLGYIIHHAPAPLLYVMPTTEMVKRASKQRITPLLESTPELRERIASPRSRDSGNTIMMKEFEGGAMVMTGANSAVGLRSMPARYLFMDEIDAYPGDLDGEGDPIALAVKRTSTFKRNRKIFMPSTPTVAGASHVERFFEQSDKRYYYVPCPHCDHYQTITWSQLTWHDNDPDTAAMVCESCGAVINEHAKTDMLERGEWRPTAETKDKALRGYHISALYSPLGWYSWGDAVREHLAAKGNRDLMKVWTNTTLGECWEEDGQQADPDALAAHAENFDADYIPDDVLMLTAGGDTQDDRIELEVIGWSAGGTPWIVGHYVCWGDPAKPKVWGEVDEVLLRQYGRHRIAATLIDSAGHHTESVYRFTKARHGRRVFPCRGNGGQKDPVSRAKQTSGQRVHLVNVGADPLKRTILGWCKEPGQAIHFSRSLDAEWYAQLTAEKMVITKRKGFPVVEWIKTRERNEAFDCLVYGYAAMLMLSPNWTILSDKAATQPPVLAVTIPESADVPRETSKPPPVRPAAPPPRRRGGFIGRF